ncbi:hypothetical protein J2X35_003941 [Mesorhizobium sp. BE184]|nr:hypothetical protein [Mesorhizobium sp. BE184]
MMEIPWPEGLSLLSSVVLGVGIFGGVGLVLVTLVCGVVQRLQPEGLDVPVFGRMRPRIFYFGLVLPIFVVLGALFGLEMGGQ